MTSNEWLGVMQQAENYNPAMTPLIIKYGEMLLAEAEKAKDERIKELKEELDKAIGVIKQWHNADEVWDIYFNNAPEMKSIRELLNNK